jgi:acetylornithine deacetylase/succinyl-diaminopimelate desuccinylase-like protein
LTTDRAIYQRPIELLRQLIRFDTTNPPGDEAACIGYLNDLLTAAGFETTLLAKTPSRPNLIARLPGRGAAPGLVLQGHVDVVTTANQAWAHPPFAAELIDNYVWGRGALDMKGGVTMMVAACLRAHAEGLQPAGDVVLTIMADEEAGSDYGARFLVEEHPEQFSGVRYAIGEGGGGSQTILGRRYYPIMVAEKQVCWMRTALHGPGGHGSTPLRGGAMARLGRLLTTLDQQRLPVHILPVMEEMIRSIVATADAPATPLLARLLDPAQTDAALDEMASQGIRQARMFDALLHNTVNATVVHGGIKTNVIPSRIELELDGRLLPGYTPDDMIAELHGLLGDDLEFEIIRHDPVGGETDLTLYPLLADLVRQADPEGTPIPTMVGGFTDGRMFARLGIQNYGFLPLKLPADFNGGATVHAADERVPVDAIHFGCEVIYQLLRRYGEESRK